MRGVAKYGGSSLTNATKRTVRRVTLSAVESRQREKRYEARPVVVRPWRPPRGVVVGSDDDNLVGGAGPSVLRLDVGAVNPVDLEALAFGRVPGPAQLGLDPVGRRRERLRMHRVPLADVAREALGIGALAVAEGDQFGRRRRERPLVAPSGHAEDDPIPRGGSYGEHSEEGAELELRRQGQATEGREGLRLGVGDEIGRKLGHERRDSPASRVPMTRATTASL